MNDVYHTQYIKYISPLGGFSPPPLPSPFPFTHLPPAYFSPSSVSFPSHWFSFSSVLFPSHCSSFSPSFVSVPSLMVRVLFMLYSNQSAFIGSLKVSLSRSIDFLFL
uniref:Uncharacterized protein n=1 Tax=Cacopsylla melanoneura TaxID=428564 RepID=A0A8D9BJW6_9HEMI